MLVSFVTITIKPIIQIKRQVTVILIVVVIFVPPIFLDNSHASIKPKFTDLRNPLPLYITKFERYG